MDEKTTSAASAEYEVSGTKYIVTLFITTTHKKRLLKIKFGA